jgi:streptogramin lyase
MFPAWLHHVVKGGSLLGQRGRHGARRSARVVFRPQLLALEERCLLDAFNEFALAAGRLPFGITAGPDGNLWFTEERGNQIGRITPAGTVTEFPIPNGNSQPAGITAGPDGNLWFTEQFARPQQRCCRCPPLLGAYRGRHVPRFGLI